MGESAPLPIASYRLPSPQASSARLLNCYAEQAPKDGRKQPTLLRRGCGIEAWGGVDDDTIAVRGMDVMSDVLYAVAGTGLYSVSSTGVATLLGSIAGTARVSMANNGTQLLICDPANRQVSSFDRTTSAVTLLAETAIKVGFLDSFFVLVNPDSNQVINSAPNDVTFDPLDIFSAEAASGNIRGMIVDHGEIVLTKDLSTELWYNAANDTGSPFSRSPDGRITMGTAAGESLGQQDNAFFCLANDKTFRRFSNSSPEKVSQYGIDSQIERLSTISDCFSFSYSQDGHLFIAWTFPAALRTFVFDCATREWHERESYDQGRWRPNCAVNAYGKQLCGDSLSGKIGIFSPDIFTEWDEVQVCEWDYQGVYAARNRLSHRRFELGINTGDAPLSGQGSDPLVTLMISDDGGKTFRTKPTRSLGTTGNYRTRVTWWNLGTSRDRVYRVQVSDPVPLFATDTILETEGHRL